MRRKSDPQSEINCVSTATLCVALLFVLMLYAFSARAAAPLSCSDPLEGHWPYGPGYTVERWTGPGETLLLVGNGAVLSIIDASDPSNLVILGEVSVADPVRSIDISPDGARVAISDWRSTIHLVDISNRSAPQARGGLVVADNRQPYGLDIVGNRLYVALRDAGLGIFDISDLDNPGALGTTAMGATGFVFDLEVRGNYAYLADDAEGVTVVDISNDASPAMVGAYAGSTLASRIVIDGSRAYVARRSNGFDILDLSVATAPTLIGNYDTPAIVYGVQPLGADRLVVADGYNGSFVFDIANPAAPAPLGSDSEPAYGLAVIGNEAYVIPDSSRPSQLRALDFSNPLTPVLSDSLDFYNDTAEVRVVGSRVLVAHRASGLSILDLANPQAPVRIGGYHAGNVDVTDVEWINGHAIVGSYGQLEVVNVSNPANPQLVATVVGPDLLLDTDRNGNRLFVTWGFSGMRIYDFANPATPALLGSFAPAGEGLLRIITKGNLAFISDQSNRVRVVDVSNPASPQQLSQTQFASFINDLSIEGTFLYVGTTLEGVRVLDVSVPTAPVEVSNIAFSPAVVNSLAARGDRLYAVAGEYAGMRSFDIGLPASPMFLDEYQTSGEALFIDMASDTIAISDGPAGVRTLTCADDTLFANGFD